MIAFSAVEGGGLSAGRPFSIYVVGADGANLRRLTDEHLFDCTDPRWSPDGNRLSFRSAQRLHQFAVASDVDDVEDIEFDSPWDVAEKQAFAHYVVDADGTNMQRLPFPTDRSWTSWRSDGRILVTSRDDDDNVVIAITEADGSGVTSLFVPDGYRYLGLSPDGGEILVVMKDRSLPHEWEWASAPGGRCLYAYSVGGRELRPLLEDGAQHSRHWYWPSWSPDGKLLAYEAEDDDGEQCLWMVDAHGLSAAMLDRRWFASSHEWSPDSRSIAYFASPGEDRYACLRNVDVVDGDVHDLATLRVEDDEGELVAAEPAWSPDGARLVFATYRAEEADGGSYLYRVDRDGSGRQRLISDQPRFDLVRDLSWGRDT